MHQNEAKIAVPHKAPSSDASIQQTESNKISPSVGKASSRHDSEYTAYNIKHIMYGVDFKVSE